MAQPSHSQMAPLPTNLPFQLVSETLGRGAYAFVRKGKDLQTNAIFAVKFIHKQFSEKYGNITPKQLLLEVGLHQHIGSHKNVIKFFASEENETWRWIAMEFADGGDLFDKIEADVGVQPDIAHFYLHQLLAGTEFIHSKGVAHRDIKPENILLDAHGNLKIADFGFATLYKHKGQVKKSTQLVGSPPYVAPEVSQGKGYVGDQVDIWSCGVVLFVLLTGNTPWDEPTDRSAEFYEYKTTNGHATYEPWNIIKEDVLPLIRGMMSVSPSSRFTMAQIKAHPWYQLPNPFLSSAGTCSNGLALATRLVEGLHVPLTQTQPHVDVSATPEDDDDHMTDYEDEDGDTTLIVPHSSASTDVIPSTQALSDDMESLSLENNELSSSQLPSQYLRNKAAARNPREQFSSYNYNDELILQSVSEDPVQSQFAPQPAVPMTLTQAARNFNDICPAGRLTRFYTIWPYSTFLPLLLSGLRKSGVPIDTKAYDEDVEELEEQGEATYIKIKTRDSRKCVLTGTIGVERVTSGEGDGLFVVGFDKAKGCPLEWRRLFKRVSVLCQDAVFRGRGLG